ncbi:sterol desaturase family protein [Thioalkalivibrio sp. ALE11]|uniref:sterol desaturase family protein n=1 Tax=Thioalkalivibrio sp. ALE11 TaxID=1265494 RepID=UPI000372C154|nr:sterol desaturase family protein [Thioalkalivibrio sp. ALE11]
MSNEPQAGADTVALLLQQRVLVELVLTFGGMVLLMMAESVVPRVRTLAETVPVARWLNNWALAVFNFFLVLWLVYLLTSSELVTHWVSTGPAPLSGMPPLVAFVVVFLVVEFLVYALHRAFHQVPWLWRLHAVHHLDTQVDVTTSHRHHSLELLLVMAVLIPVVTLLGPEPLVLLGYFVVRVTVILVSHSNLRLPRGLDRVLRWLVVTPDFHRLHHAADRRHTDSNYGTVTPWFDYLFGSATDLPYGEHDRLVTGLEYLRDTRDSRVDRLMLLPFRWHRLRSRRK